jgi:predicted peptidase
MPPAACDTRAMQTLREITAEVLATCAVDRRRVYLTGISMGGYGTWHWAAAEPGLFAAVAPVCGGGDPARAAALKNTPVWAVHGDQDDAVPVERSRRMIEAIRTAGGTPRYSELAGVGHHSWKPAYDPAFGLLDWMFEQRK